MFISLQQDDNKHEPKQFSQLNTIISPISANGFQNYFSQDQSVHLSNCQVKDVISPHTVEDPYEINDEETHPKRTLRDTKKINSRSASYHFSTTAADGNEIMENAGNTMETRGAFGSPLTKNVR